MFQIEGITPAETWSWKLRGTFGEFKGYYKNRKERRELLGDNTGEASQRDPGYIV